MSSLDLDRAGEPAVRGWRLGSPGLWVMGAYWLAMLAVFAIGAANGG